MTAIPAMQYTINSWRPAASQLLAGHGTDDLKPLLIVQARSKIIEETSNPLSYPGIYLTFKHWHILHISKIVNYNSFLCELMQWLCHQNWFLTVSRTYFEQHVSEQIIWISYRNLEWNCRCMFTCKCWKYNKCSAVFGNIVTKLRKHQL